MKLHQGLLRLAFVALKGPIVLVAMIGLAVTACWVTQGLLLANALALGLRGAPPQAFTAPVSWLLAVVLLRACLVWCRDVAARWAGLIIKQRLRRTLFGRLLDLGPAHTATCRTGALQSLLVDGVEGLEGYYAYYLSQALVVFVGSAGVLGYLATINLVVATVLAVFLALVPIVPKFWHRRLARRGESHWESYQEVESDYLDAIQGMTTLKALDAVAGYRTKLERRIWRLYRRTMRQLAVSLVGTSLTTLLVRVAVAVAVVLAAIEFAAGELTPTELFIVLLLSGECFRPMADLAGYWHMSYLGFSAGNEVTALVETARRTPVVSVPKLPPAGDVPVVFREVSFTYPGRPAPALCGFRLSVATGETLAIVGHSGAGKTTVLNLALGFLSPDTGTVEIGGQDVRSLPATVLHQLVTLVPQDPYLFHGTVEDNLRIARPDVSAAKLWHAVEVADFSSCVAGLEAGLRTSIGERGIRLSAGQRQRLAIARAVLREAPVLLLDEATANLDGESEAALAPALSGLSGVKTAIVVAHRLSTIRTADRVVVLHEGKVVQSGPPGDLLAVAGPYQRMVRLDRAKSSGGAA